MENRISFSSELASLMWFHDEKEAKAMYGGVVSDFKQLLAQFDAQMNIGSGAVDDDESESGGIFSADTGRVKVERKFRIAMQVRQQIAMSLAEHAPDLAYNFFYDSLNLITNPQFRKGDRTDRTSILNINLIKQIAETDAAKAARLRQGIDQTTASTYNHIELLKKIYAKDAEKGIEFGAAILSRLKSETNQASKTSIFTPACFRSVRHKLRGIEKARRKKGDLYSKAICATSPSNLPRPSLTARK